MDKEFTVSTWYKIFYGAIAVGMFIFSIFLFDTYNPLVSEAILLMPFSIMIGSILIFVNIIRRKIIVYNDSIQCINLFTRKELAIADIKGCRVGQKALVLEPKLDGSPKIVIGNYGELSNSEELTKWFTDNFKDLDKAELEADTKRVLQDSELGVTLEERQKVIDSAKTKAILYNVSVILLGIIVLLFNTSFIMIIAMLYPLLGIGLMATSKGLIKFVSNSTRSVGYFIMLGFFGASLIPLISDVSSYNILRFNNFWPVFLGVGVVLFLLLLITGINKRAGAIVGQVIVIIVAAGLYAGVCIVQVNCRFDNTAVKIYKAEVTNRYITHGKSTNYFLTVEPWGPSLKQEDINVGYHMYNDKNIGDTVKINFRPGLLNIPWFTVTK